MSKALGYDKEDIFTEKPSLNKVLIDITDVAKLTSRIDGQSIPTFWTYHPNYLNYLSALEESVIKISELIKQ